MKLTGLATAFFIIGCSGSSKTPAKPAPTDDTTAAGSGSAATDPAGTGDMAAQDKEPAPPDTGGYQITAPDALQWAPLDPNATGGPEMAVAHGDPTAGASAFFLRVPPGGKSGLHTHTADYQAVVVSGAPKHFLVGGDKKAKALAVGSHWFQPGGQAHGDECTGKEPCVLFIVSNGAFDFTATPKAKKGAAGKYKLVAAKDEKFAPLDPTHPEGVKAAFVYGDPKVGPTAFVIEIPAGVNAGLHSHTASYHAVVLQGAPAHWLPFEKDEGTASVPGTYWFQPGGYDHGDRCTSTDACRAFVYVDGAFDFKPAAVK